MTIITPEALRTAILAKLTYAVGKDAAHAHDHDWYIATALAIRDKAVDRWIATTRTIYATGQKRVYYLSLDPRTRGLYHALRWLYHRRRGPVGRR